MYFEPIYIIVGAIALHWLAGFFGDVFRDTKFGEYLQAFNAIPLMVWVMGLFIVVMVPVTVLAVLTLLANWIFGLCLEGFPCG